MKCRGDTIVTLQKFDWKRYQTKPDRSIPLPMNVGDVFGTGAVGKPLTKRSYRASNAPAVCATMIPAPAGNAALRRIAVAATNANRAAPREARRARKRDMIDPSEGCGRPVTGPGIWSPGRSG